MKRRVTYYFTIIGLILLVFSSSSMANEFQVIPPKSVVLTSPNGGENFMTGEKYLVTWEQTHTEGLAQIEYSRDSGDTWIVISLTNSSDSYWWTVPDQDTTTKARVRVRWYDGNKNYYDMSDADFTITKSLGLQIIAVAVPNAPSNLSANAFSSSVINLDWEDNSTNEVGFKLERKTDGEYAEIADLAADATGYVDANLIPETTYTYRLHAYNNVGNSQYSNEVSIETLPDLELAPVPIPDPPIEIPDPQIDEPIIIKLYINQAEYYVNNDILTMDTVPIISNSRTLLPIRYVAEALGATVSWDGPEQKVTIELNDTTIELWINKKDARVNGVMEQIDPINPNVIPFIVPPGRTMLPLRFIVETLGSSVEWDPLIQEVLITYPKI